MMHLLDTDSCVGYLRNRPPILVQRILAAPRTSLRLCSVVKAELYYGALISRQLLANLAKIQAFVQPIISLPFDDTVAEHYGRIKADLAAKGTLIGPNDLLIAAIAVAHNLTLVTHNTREFGRVSGLAIVDWQIP